MDPALMIKEIRKNLFTNSLTFFHGCVYQGIQVTLIQVTIQVTLIYNYFQRAAIAVGVSYLYL